MLEVQKESGSLLGGSFGSVIPLTPDLCSNTILYQNVPFQLAQWICLQPQELSSMLEILDKYRDIIISSEIKR